MGEIPIFFGVYKNIRSTRGGFLNIEECAKQIRALGNGHIPVDPWVIAQRLRIEVLDERSPSVLFSESGRAYIVVDERKDEFHRHIDCAHEIGHYVLHEGNQMLFPKLWTDYQETQAWAFALYLLVPTEEIESMIVPGIGRQQCIVEVSQHFRVPLSFASKRLQIFEHLILRH